jgi:hypothetical protein
MAEKVTKRKPKEKREKPSVLGNLPATRPQRLGRPRTDTPVVSEEPTPAPARTKREIPRPKPAAGPAKVQASAAASTSKPTPVKRAAAKPQPSPASAAESKPAPAKAKPARRRRAATHETSRIGPPRRPTAVRPGARPLEPQPRVGDPPPARTVQAPRGTELVTTTIQAVGELAQLGLTMSGRALKRAVDRLPRP